MLQMSNLINDLEHIIYNLKLEFDSGKLPERAIDFSETLWKNSIAAKKQKNSFMSQSGVPDAIYEGVWKSVTTFLVTNATTKSIMGKMTITDGRPAKVQLTK